eukprot:m.267373 g.267373  ORF g.267373 m.267373 type:complete len:607 (+) comp33111_c0_seq1:72-1892(+)
MRCVILVAGSGARLQEEIQASPRHRHLVNVPKALLPLTDGKCILDNWWFILRAEFSEVVLVSNANKYKHFERWATGVAFNTTGIINDGCTSEKGLGGLADLNLAVTARHLEEDEDGIFVVAGDMVFDTSFDVQSVINYAKKVGDVVCYYQMLEHENASSRGIITVDRGSSKITHFFEKPNLGETDSRLASVVLYRFTQATVKKLQQYIKDHPDCRGPGQFIQHLVASGHDVYGMKLPDHFKLIGQVGLADYERCLEQYEPQTPEGMSKPIICRAFARVGLMGNPSDGFGGKTISMAMRNFWAEVSICASPTLVLVPHPLNDPNEFRSLNALWTISTSEGYQGGLRLMQATCKRFYQFCTEKGIAIPRKNFTLKYDTNIPRQVGLAGSSAIISASLKCLMKFFGLTRDDIPLEVQPSFVLSVEMEELRINAGLQDRVIQAYEGLVYMDFDPEIMKKQGYGIYERIPIEKAPPLWIAYLPRPSDSGKIHSDVRARFDMGDETVLAAMKQFAAYTDKAREALLAGNHEAFADLMDANFTLRTELYTIDPSNMAMIELARKNKAAVKFPGSGGAVVGMCRPAVNITSLKAQFEANGYVFVELVPKAPTED